MTSLRITNAWLAASGLLAMMTLSACPRGDFDLGIEDAGTETGNENMEPGKDAGGDDKPSPGNGNSAAKCGSRGLPECAEDEFCSYPQSASCGDTDKAGVCKKKPDVCTKIFKAVCGCDGTTYGNSCEAESAGVSIRSDGECDGGAPSEKVCGGFSGKQCDDGEYCNYPDGALCGIADATGICEKRPDDCKDPGVDPVCGCNGVTYANACEANRKGFGVMNAGKCENQSQLCGFTISAACPDDAYCQFPEVGQCGEGPEFGSCQKKPDACAEIFKPVCGCDGKTYGNECEAQVAGVSVQSEGECKSDGGSEDGAVCGVRGAAQCADDEFCYFTLDSQCAAADVPGHCRKRPDACTFIEKKVCGCDGKTYGNECIASQEGGTGIAYEGECGGMSEPAACGGLQGGQCKGGEYCKFTPEQQCGAADQTGVCTVIKQACTREFHQVCGCDGNTYNNPCLAGAAGTSVASEGACESTEPATCGGLQGGQCKGGEFCKIAVGDQCGAADQTGVCTAIPSVCTQEFHEVCGCDGKTYPNPCNADAAGQSIVSDGPCPASEPAACGGLQGLQCADKQFCNFPPAAQCGAADQLGECTNVPDVCTAISKPVCGCDGKTYDNACQALVARQSVASEGTCRQTAPANEGGLCGGFAGILCSGDLYCQFALTTMCGSGDQSGTCKTKPEVCTDISKPVCGCDNKTYGNECNAQTEGVSVLHDGPC